MAKARTEHALTNFILEEIQTPTHSSGAFICESDMLRARSSPEARYYESLRLIADFLSQMAEVLATMPTQTVPVNRRN